MAGEGCDAVLKEKEKAGAGEGEYAGAAEDPNENPLEAAEDPREKPVDGEGEDEGFENPKAVED